MSHLLNTIGQVRSHISQISSYCMYHSHFRSASLHLIHQFTIITGQKFQLLFTISPCHVRELTPRVHHALCTDYTKYSISQVQHTPSIAYTEYIIHQVQHALNTPFTEYTIHCVQHAPSTAHTPQKNLNQSGSNTQFSQTLRATTPVLRSTSRCSPNLLRTVLCWFSFNRLVSSQTLLEVCKVLSDYEEHSQNALRFVLWNSNILKLLRSRPRYAGDFERSWTRCTALRNMSRAAETAAQLCGRLCAIFTPQWFLHTH